MTPLQSENKKPEVVNLRWLDQSNYQEMKHRKGLHTLPITKYSKPSLIWLQLILTLDCSSALFTS
jgi:hypothetical protein